VVDKSAVSSEIYDSELKCQVVNKKNKSFALSELKLVERARNNDTWAIEQLICRYSRKAHSIAYRLCSGDNEKAKDLVQDAFLKAFSSIHKFKGKSSFYTWLYRIVVNTCLDAMRRRQRKKKIFSLFCRSEQDNGRTNRHDIENYPDISQKADPVDLLKNKDLRMDIQKALTLLSEKQRVIFELKIFDEMKIHEIAKIMNMADGTVKSHLFRATNCIRKALKDWKRK